MLLLPATLRAKRVENEKWLAHLQHQDLALIDLFTQKGWLKLAQRFGCWNATLIIFIISLVLLSILVTGLELLVNKDFNLARILVSSTVMSLLLSSFFYLTVKKTKDKVIFWKK
jgi:hypothetical protein